MTQLPFYNRGEAGRLLAERLRTYANRPDVLVLALPRGGVRLNGMLASCPRRSRLPCKLREGIKMREYKLSEPQGREVSIVSGSATLEGELTVPHSASGLVLFAHGSGSSRHSPRNRYVARVIREADVGTLLFDLLTPEEEAIDQMTGNFRFDIGFLAGRLTEATRWVAEQPDLQHLRVGYFGSSTGGAAALVAAAAVGEEIGAVVSRGGRPDLAGPALPRVVSPTLLIVGERDEVVRRLNEAAYEELQCEKELKIIPGATHLFEEPGTLEEVARLAAQWFREHLQARYVTQN